MRIESMDAQNVSYSNVQSSKANTKDNTVNQADLLLDIKSISQMTDAEKNELQVSNKALFDATERANRAIVGVNRRFDVSIHEKTKRVMVKVIDTETNETIREIPPEKILNMIGKLWELAGIIVDERR